MKIRFLAAILLTVVVLPAFALDGQIGIHDPSTIVQCDGKFYTFGTGSGGLISDDGWTWRGGAVRDGGGVAPDICKIGDRYLVTYAAMGNGVYTMWTKTLDPNSPDFGYTDRSIIASGDVDCDAIDSALLLAPDGRLWLTYGSYRGYIREIELDPKTGKPLNNDKPRDIAINCEATEMIYRDGWYYLLANHGSCCIGAGSTYSIRMGRSKSPTGPFLDNMGVDMLRGGGKLFVAAAGRVFGPGHFGLLDLGDGVQKWSCHYESDLDHPGNFGVLDIRPLLWRDGWPVAGDNFKGGTYKIESARAGMALELAVEGATVGGGGRGGRGGGGRGAGAGAGRGGGGGAPVPDQDVASVSGNWPAGNIEPRMGFYMCQAQQKWTIAPVANAGGYPGSPFFKIAIAGTERVLAATEDAELVTLPAFTGGPEQLWRIDQLTDGTYRIMPKAVPNSKEPLVLTAVGNSFATLARFDPASDNPRWNLRAP
jgi:arabinan endo-1,5-alpha-L-arabinosidase